jgi:amidophosphoribosyltransferase
LFHTTSDTEVIAYLIYKHRLTTATIGEAIEKAMGELEGAYSLLIMTSSQLIAVRDPHGFRPLCLGKLDDGYVFASESCALDAVGAVFVRDLEPGEMCIVDAKDQKMTSSLVHAKKVASSLCVFELIYFARPDSVIDTISVHQARIRSGCFLALEHPCQADVVIGVPDSGIDAAIGYARQSGIPYGIGFIKNKYIGRTFIQPKAGDRESGVRIKLNPIASTVRGKRVVLIDDSIVRGTTSKRIVRLLREAGAVEVHLRSSAPPFLHPCYYGTDIDSRKELLACKYDLQQMKAILDVDSLGFLLPEQVVKLSDHPGIGFCSACFTGVYPTAVGKGATYA